MKHLHQFTPGPLDWRVRWEEMDSEYPFIQRMRGCPQDPVFHAEGDVWIHTRMVCEALAALPAWRSLPENDRRLVFTAAVLHDVAKPDCTRRGEDGRISSRGHSARGAILSRQLLWREHASLAWREQVCALIRYHQTPYYLIDRPDARRLAVEVSQTARCDLLGLLAEADVRGRICADQQRLLDNVALFLEQTRELGCLYGPYPFANDHARVLFFLDDRRILEAPAHAEFRGEVVVMSGLPGSGKDHFLHSHLRSLPVISLDDLREEMDVDPTESQGQVVQEARERAREYLRRGESFVWNGTNLSRPLRRMVLELFAGYRARLKIVYVEVPPEVQLQQMRQRGRVIPDRAMQRMLDRWEVPDRTEAHDVVYHVAGNPLNYQDASSL